MMIYNGNNIDVMAGFDENSIDSIVTDPPYGFKFMGKKWDYDVPSVEFWSECLRVLKPGGFVLSFGGTRTYHRMVVNIEDAGFEIRDCIQWIYGSGFPKSLDISKAIDKKFGAEREVVGKEKNYGNTKTNNNYGEYVGEWNITKPATPEAQQWEGFGTSLKPACEIICLARKPIKTTVVENVLKYGTGGLNIDACRIEIDENDVNQRPNGSSNPNSKPNTYGKYKTAHWGNTLDMQKGRFPSNVILDEESAKVLDEQSGELGNNYCGGRKTHKRLETSNTKFKGIKETIGHLAFNDSGGASRFFYIPKASKQDRNEGLQGFEKGYGLKKEYGIDRLNTHLNQKNTHPTVKPTKLMQYLVRLVTPPKGICLDPYMGSGSTGKACAKLGFEFIGIELNEDYFKIAEARIENEFKQNRLEFA